MITIRFLKIGAISLNLCTFIITGILMAYLPKAALGESVFIGAVSVNSNGRVDAVQADQGSMVSVSSVRISGSRLENDLTVRQMSSNVGEIRAGRDTRVSVASLNIHNSRIEGRTSLDMSVRVNGDIQSEKGADVQIGSFSIGDNSRNSIFSDEGLASVNGITGDRAVDGMPLNWNKNEYPDIPEELQYAYLSQCVYDDPEKGCVYDDPERKFSKGQKWSEVGDSELEKMGLNASDFVDPITGFKAKLFLNDKGEYVLAFAGTDQKRDWVSANIPQLIIKYSPQYMKAMELAEKVSTSLGDNKPLSFTGHSLGGGLASAASLVTGKKATTFNAAYINTQTVINYAIKKLREDSSVKSIAKKLEQFYSMESKILINRMKSDDLVTAYTIKHEPLIGHEIGRNIRLDPPNELSFFDFSDKHAIQTMIDVMETSYDIS